MLLNMGAQIHTVNYQLQGQFEHRQDAIETHAIAGFLLIVLLAARIGSYKLFKAQIPRQEIDKKNHKIVITVIHSLPYLTILSLAASGLAMAVNSDVPLNLLGYTFSNDVT